MVSSSWKFAVATFALLNLLLLLPGHTFALPTDGLDSTAEKSISPDGSGPSAHSATTIFNFMASGLCSKTTGQCIEISGSGTVRFNDELKAKGHFLKYKEGEQFRAPTYYIWTVTELVNANPIRVHFKATTAVGIINIAVTEGEEPTSGIVCIWGTLNGITGPN